MYVTGNWDLREGNKFLGGISMKKKIFPLPQILIEHSGFWAPSNVAFPPWPVVAVSQCELFRGGPKLKYFYVIKKGNF